MMREVNDFFGLNWSGIIGMDGLETEPRSQVHQVFDAVTLAYVAGLGPWSRRVRYSQQQVTARFKNSI